jgi:hypothetical protein
VSKARDKGRIFFDIDGFVGPTDSVPPRPASHPALSMGRAQELSMIHYLLRSALVLSTDFPKSSWPDFLKFSEACADNAERIVGHWDKVPNPVWVGDFRQALKSSGKVDPEAVDEIGLGYVLTPRIYAYCFPASRRIEVSAIAREHLRTINLILWIMAQELYQKHEAIDFEAVSDDESIVDLLLPHLFSLYFSNVDYSSLPIIRAPDEDILQRAMIGASIQVEFMVAHEYAHLLFHEGQAPNSNLEREADAFSYELLLDSQEFWKNDSGTFFTSCRWFFLYLSLDRIIGAVLSGYEIDWVDVPIRGREMWLVERIRDIRFSSIEKRECQTWGDILLFQAKRKLHERGVDWIRSAAREFEEQHCFS